ncbi:MAG: amino acid permease [Proteobacteria bacterium]|nr:amino acid permease [Pseudomonadota bacterium]
MGMKEQGELKRILSFWDVFFIAVGQIIGAGVIALTGVAIGMTGPSVTVAYFGAAILVLLASVLYMMAGATLPSIGAFYVWPARLGNGWLGSTVLLLILLASITLGLYGSSFGLYLNPLFPALSVNMWGVVAIAFFFLANLFGLKIASKVQMGLVIVLISALAVYAGFAMPEVQAANLTPMFPKGILGFLTAIFLLKFATGGAYMIVVLGGEMKNPQRDIPLIMITATLAVAVVYGFVALASVGVIPWEKMVNQPLTVAGKAFLPGWALIYFLVAGAGLAICTTLNAQFIQLPRNFIVASWDNLIPAWMGKVNKYGAPYYILFAMLVIGVVPLLVGLDIGSIARAATISATLPGFIMFCVITRIPKKFPEEYEKSLFKLNRFWIWFFFAFSMISMGIGVILLSRDLSKPVLGTLLVWIVLSIVYYPIRRSFLKKRGIDLDALTTDPAVMKMS